MKKLKRDFPLSYSLGSAERTQGALEHFRKLGAIGLWPSAVLFADAHIELRREGGLLVLKELWVSPTARGTGRGSYHLDQLCRIADLWAVSVKIRVHPYGRGPRLSDKVLREWYAGRGFKATRGATMLREPRRVDPACVPMPVARPSSLKRDLFAVWRSPDGRLPRASSRR